MKGLEARAEPGHTHHGGRANLGPPLRNGEKGRDWAIVMRWNSRARDCEGPRKGLGRLHTSSWGSQESFLKRWCRRRVTSAVHSQEQQKRRTASGRPPPTPSNRFSLQPPNSATDHRRSVPLTQAGSPGPDPPRLPGPAAHGRAPSRKEELIKIHWMAPKITSGAERPGLAVA